MKILVLETSGLNLGYLGCYGSDWVATPHLDRLASEGVVFDRHIADRLVLDGRDESSAWTGLYRFPYPGDTDPAFSMPFSFPEWLKQLDIPLHRVAVSLADFEMRVGEVLDILEDRWLLHIRGPDLAPPWTIPGDWLEHYFPPPSRDSGEEEEILLDPWLDPPVGLILEKDLERVQNTYAAAVSFLDDLVGLLLETLGENDVLNQVLICFTASSGLTMGEHGFLGPYRAWLHEEVVHLPLILRLPKKAEVARAGLRISAMTQPVDLLPTWLEFLGREGEPARALHGKSLWPLIGEDMPHIRPYACSGWKVGESLEWSLRTQEGALLVPVEIPSGDRPRRPQFFVKPDDRWEINDLYQQNEDLAQGYERTLREFMAAARQPGILQPPPLYETMDGT